METITTQWVLSRNTSLGWIYGELMKKNKILELLYDAEFFCAFFHLDGAISLV